MSKHTEGPWQRGKSPRAIYHQKDGHWKKIASVGIYGETTHEDMANADLIAAAPDLLKALKYIYQDLKQHAIPNYNDPWWQEAEAVIAKAEPPK